MTRRLAVAAGALLCALPVPLRADSPLTSTDLAGQYLDIPAVRQARDSHRLANEVLKFLLAPTRTDHKAAVVNALGWQGSGNAEAFVRGLARARGVEPEELKLAQLTAADRFVLGYLLAMETYLEPRALRPGAMDLWGATPLQLLDQAAQALPDDFTVHYVRGLLEAQRVMAESGCSVYLATQRVLERFPPARRNLRPAAVVSAQQYMELYKKDCGQAAVAPPPKAGAPATLDPEHDQVYALALVGGRLVASTQAGVVVWDPAQRRPLASRDEKICAHLLAWRGSAWAGCHGRLVRWDGTGWKGYLQDPTRGDDAYAPMLGPKGELLVRYGLRVWAYEPERDAFVEGRGLGGEAHDALFRRNGELWRIEFLRAVIGPRGRLERGSPEYPGRDPRTLVEDATGRLWVADFDNGLMSYDDASGRFLRDPTLDGKGVTVAADPPRRRTWYLHYTSGPRLVQDGQVVPTPDLSDLQYMRDLLLDESTGDVWVAGWTGIVRLHASEKGWTRQDWSVGPRPRPGVNKKK